MTKDETQKRKDSLDEYDKPDRLGVYIGKLRKEMKISQMRLAEGLCSEKHLANIEIGNREADKLLTDALLQRLGKPVDLFMRILSDQEVQSYRARIKILDSLKRGENTETEQLVEEYRKKALQVEHIKNRMNCLDQQFINIIELNLAQCRGEKLEDLQKLVEDTLRLTQPRYGELPISELILSRNEGYLIVTALELREKLEGKAAVESDWYALLEDLQCSHYEKGERVYLAPYVVCHVARAELEKGNAGNAKRLCEQMLQELAEEKRTNGQYELLQLAKEIEERMGRDSRKYAMLMTHHRYMKEKYAHPSVSLWIPFEEGENVHHYSQVVAGRRKFLKMDQFDLAGGEVEASTIYRIEEKGTNPQKRIRRYLLEQVHMSGERYDYDIITDNYEDYLLRSKFGRAANQKKWEEAEHLLEELKRHTPDTLVNMQYLDMASACIRLLPKERNEYGFWEERITGLWKFLRMTLPTFPEKLSELDEFPSIVLSTNEIQILKQLAFCYEKQGKAEKGLQILFYVKNCLETAETKQGLELEEYTFCMRALVSMLGNQGRYHDSNNVSKECLSLLLNKNHSERMSGFLYSILWNREQEWELYSGDRLEKEQEECFEMLVQTYAAALLQDDVQMLQHIQKHSLQVYGKEIGINF